jgi:hypothetical protein
MMVSLFDFRKTHDADASRLGIYIDNLSRGDVNVWITRNADQTIVTVSYPDTAEGRHSVHHYIGVLRQAFGDAERLKCKPKDRTDLNADDHPVGSIVNIYLERCNCFGRNSRHLRCRFANSIHNCLYAHKCSERRNGNIVNRWSHFHGRCRKHE